MPLSLEPASVATQRSTTWTPQLSAEIHESPRGQFGCTRQMLVAALPLLLADLVAVAASVLFASTLVSFWSAVAPSDAGLLLLSVAAGLVVANTILGLYPGTGLHPMVELRASSLSVLLTNALLLAALLPSQTSWAVISVFQIAVLCLFVSLPLCRIIVRELCSRIPGWGQATLVLGDGDSALRIFDAMQSNPDRGLRPVGILGDPMSFNRDIRDYPYSGPISEAPAVARRSSAYWAVIAMPDRPTAEVGEMVNDFAAGIPNVIVTTADEIPSLWSHAFSGLGLSGVYFQRGLLLPLPRIAKRTFDIVASLVGGLLILPLLAMIAAAIRISSPGPVIYKQRRIGHNGRYFLAWKFRTMRADADKVLEEYLNSNPQFRQEWEADHKLRKDPRITAIGHLLRKTSLDELPQIWNVIKGEMSLVGPRPIVDAEVVKYGRDFDLYASVLPGISGLWQVSGRNDTTYQQRVDLDSYYVRNWSPWMDFYILIKTVGVIVTREGAY